MVYGTCNELVTGAFCKPTYNWGASHCMRCNMWENDGNHGKSWDIIFMAFMGFKDLWENGGV